MTAESEARRSTQVLVVGAGPTGLLLASELERRGVSCVLIDALDAPRGWDRATVVHPRSMEIFEALGLADRFLERGVKTRKARIRSGGEVLGDLDLELNEGRYPFDLGLSEEVTESIVTEHLERHGGGVTRSSRLVDVRAEEDGIVARMDQGNGFSEVAASWVVGCDGLHSAVRELAGIEFLATAPDTRWAVFDAAVEGWEDDFDMAAAFLERPPVILTPLPGRRWRVYQQPTRDDSDLVADALGVVRAYMPEATFADVANAARFHCHSRVAASFRSGRVLLAGDAAHACSPAEGHGMNTGLQDAFNLGWKLALVCRGEAGADLLDSYEVERRPVAARIVESGVAAEGGYAIPTEADRATRDEEIRRIYAASDSAHHEAVAAAELDRSYAGSPVVAGTENECLGPGVRVPDMLVARSPAGAACAVHELVHQPGHTLLVVGGERTSSGDVLELVTALRLAHRDSPLVDSVVALSADTGAPSSDAIWAIDASAAAAMGVEGLVVLAVRPDRYVGFRHDGGDPDAVAGYLDRLVA